MTLFGSSEASGVGLLRSGIGVAIVMGWNRLVMLLLAMVLARYLGASGVGVYALAFSVLSVLTLFVELGFPVLVEREIASGAISARWALVRGLLNMVVALQLIFGTLLAAAVILSTRAMDNAAVWLLIALMTPCMSLFRVGCHVLSGLHRVFTARLLEHAIRPTLVLALILPLFALSDTLRSPVTALAVHLGVLLAVLAGVAVLAKRALPRALNASQPAYAQAAWLKSGTTLALGLAAVTVNTQFDILILGAFYPTAEVGLYRMAVQGSSLVGFAMVVASMWLTPQFARLWAKREVAGLQTLVTRAARVIAISAVLGAVILGLFGRELLQLLFGSEFIGSYPPMVLLLFTHVIAGLVGALGPLLNMTGHEAVGARAIAVGAAVNLVLNVLLVPTFGMMGAATGTLIAAFVWYSMISLGIYRNAGIRPTVLG